MRRIKMVALAMFLLTACATSYRVPKSADMPDSSIGKRTWEQPKVAP